MDGLRRQLESDLACLGFPAKPWVLPRDGMRDVVIIGAGMTGLAVAAALRLHGVTNIAHLDRAPQGREGPWVTTARMRTLRTAKAATGPALGIPSLTYRRWHEARFGADDWDGIDKVPREAWMDYLNWYREVLALPVENGVAATRIVPREDGSLVVRTLHDGAEADIATRHVVLATGFDGFGGPAIPAFAQGLDRRFWRHSSEEIDFAALKGKRVGVVGFGASAIDNGATALEMGAASVDFFVRRPELPAVQKMAPLRNAGFSFGYGDLDDAWKLRLFRYELETQNPPPRHSIDRLMENDRVRMRVGCPVTAAEERNGAVALTTPQGQQEVDFLVLATGFDQKAEGRDELAELLPHVRRWHDVHPELQRQAFAQAPYLDRHFAFQEKTAGAAPALRRVYCPTDASILSCGRLAVGTGNLSDMAMAITRRISSEIFADDCPAYFELAQANNAREFELEDIASILVSS